MNYKTNISPHEPEDDLFLREAQEGWAQFPGARSRWWKKKLQFSLFLFGKSWSVLPAAGKLAVGTLTSVAIITVAAVTIPFNTDKDKPVIAQQQEMSEKTSNTAAEEIKTTEEPVFDGSSENIENTRKALLENTNTGKAEQMAPVALEESENRVVSEAEGDKDFFSNYWVSEAKEEDTDRMNPLQSKKLKSNVADDFDDALPYIWVDQYRILDYDALNAEIPQATSTATSGGLDTRFSNHDEKVDVPASVSYDTISYKTFLGDAVIKLKFGNYSEAEYQFKKLLVQRPADENALFYLGYCSFQKGEYPQALSYFEKTKKSTYQAFAADAEWYTARIYLLSGDRTKAKNLLQKIERQKGSFMQEAQDLLEQEFHE